MNSTTVYKFFLVYLVLGTILWFYPLYLSANASVKGLLQVDTGDTSSMYKSDSSKYVKYIAIRRLHLNLHKKWNGWKFKLGANLNPKGENKKISKAMVESRSDILGLRFGYQKPEWLLSGSSSNRWLIGLERPHFIEALRHETIGFDSIFRWQEFRILAGVHQTVNPEPLKHLEVLFMNLRSTWSYRNHNSFLLHLGFNYRDDDPKRQQTVNLNPRNHRILINQSKKNSKVSRQQSFGAEIALLCKGPTAILEMSRRHLHHATFTSNPLKRSRGVIDGFSLQLAYQFSNTNSVN